MYFFTNVRFFWTGTCFILFVVNSIVVNAETCPARCSCKWKSGKQTVECMDRGLISIPENIDVETQVLDASGNNLQTLSRETFLRSRLVNLQKLFLKNCRIGLIEDLAFKGLTNLIELDLSHNLLTSVPSNVFKDTPFLRELILSHNPIQKITSMAFHDLHGLVKLDLSNCEIQTIALRAFEGIELLESLKLNGNRLSELLLGTIETLNGLHGIDLHNNPWYCDCRLRPIKEWLIKTNIPYSEVPLCLGGPERLILKSFRELHVDDFACKPDILPSNRFIETTNENNATIVCRANAIPPAIISWFWHGKKLQNNSAISLSTKIQIYEAGSQEKSSTLVLNNIQEEDVHEFYCVAENRAGNFEANFTLFVMRKRFSFTNLENQHLAALSASLVLLIFSVITIISITLAKLRGRMKDTKPSNHQTLSVDVNVSDKSEDSKSNDESSKSSNIYCPIQKSIRSSEIPYSTVHYNGNGSIMSESCFVLPSSNGDSLSTTDRDLLQFACGEYTKSDNLLLDNWENFSQSLPRRNPDLISNDDGYLNSNRRDLLVQDNHKVSANYPPDYGLPILDESKVKTANEVALPSNAKTLRVWQKGAVPVLPPVTTLKRVLGHNRSSPDEGFQDGCGTDV